MAAKSTRLTHKIAIQLHLVAERCTVVVLAPGGQSGKLWIHPRMLIYLRKMCTFLFTTGLFYKHVTSSITHP